jgi:hypothetical protein
VLYSKYRIREFESSSSGSVVTTTLGFDPCKAGARPRLVVERGVLVAQAPSTAKTSANVTLTYVISTPLYFRAQER